MTEPMQPVTSFTCPLRTRTPASRGAVGGKEDRQTERNTTFSFLVIVILQTYILIPPREATVSINLQKQEGRNQTTVEAASNGQTKWAFVSLPIFRKNKVEII